jgi:hypothetical protein
MHRLSARGEVSELLLIFVISLLAGALNAEADQPAKHIDEFLPGSFLRDLALGSIAGTRLTRVPVRDAHLTRATTG